MREENFSRESRPHQGLELGNGMVPSEAKGKPYVQKKLNKDRESAIILESTEEPDQAGALQAT